MFSAKQLQKILTYNNLFSKQDFENLKKEAQDQDLESFLIDSKIISKAKLYKLVANYFKVPLISLKNFSIPRETLNLIPEALAVQNKIIVFSQEKNCLNIASLNPDNIDIFEFLHKKTGLEIKVNLVLPEEFQALVVQYKNEPSLNVSLKDGKKKLFFVASEVEKHGQENNILKLQQKAQDLSVVNILDDILDKAIKERASDIHIEPGETGVYIRFRIDGILREKMILPLETQPGLAARVKIIANLKVDEHRLPQDGRFKIVSDKQKISFRISILPVYDGEKIVIRILREDEKGLSLEQLGLSSVNLEIVKNNLAKPNGMILITGPTGSGKTTTLYTLLNILNQPGVNISTIEDPIEYRMPGVNQSQVNTKIGYNFAYGLRAFLRQDPNIIMVGEIRDQETAEIAVNAALTGHLLLSTLHTNDAVSAPSRLLNMGVAPFLVASTANLIIAQRLVRKICPNCIESSELDNATLHQLDALFNVQKVLNTLKKGKIVSNKTKSLREILFCHGRGCKDCGQTGYNGRVGIYEIFEITHEIQELILRQAGYREIAKQAEKQKMSTLLEDGFMKAAQGITTIEEIIRATKE